MADARNPTQRQRNRAGLRRYAVAQMPGLTMVVLVTSGMHVWAGVSVGAVVAICALWIAKDALLYPWLRAAYEGDDRLPVERLVGRRGVVTRPLAPMGYVRVGPELWRARAADPEGPLETGAPIEVVGTIELVLVVRSAQPASRD